MWWGEVRVRVKVRSRVESRSRPGDVAGHDFFILTVEAVFTRLCPALARKLGVSVPSDGISSEGVRVDPVDSVDSS